METKHINLTSNRCIDWIPSCTHKKVETGYIITVLALFAIGGLIAGLGHSYQIHEMSLIGKSVILAGCVVGVFAFVAPHCCLESAKKSRTELRRLPRSLDD